VVGRFTKEMPLMLDDELGGLGMLKDFVDIYGVEPNGEGK
jgi:hypothetical protein